MSTKGLSRREFLRIASITGAGLIVSACAPTPPAVPPAGGATAAPAATSAPAASAPRSGGILRVADQYDGVSVGWPAKLSRVYSNRQAAPAIETLFRTDKSGAPVPWLATGYTNDPAVKTITIPLKKGIKFHDGTDFNAAVAKWNLEQCVSAKVGATAKFKSVDVVDDSTIRITLTDWDNTVVSSLAQTIGMMVSPEAVTKNGEDWAANNPVGTGPFQFVSWQKDVKTVYKKFDGYWQKGKPYLDGVEYNVQPDPVTRALSFKRGELDLILTLNANDLAGFEKEGFVVNRRLPGSGANGVIPDSANPASPWSKLQVRQAAQHAIDSEALVKTVISGEGRATNQFIYKGHWAYNESVVGYPYNPAKAKQLLTEAGYPNGFKTKLAYRVGAPADQVMTAVQGFLKEVGIEVELDPNQLARYDATAMQGGKWEGLIQNAASPNPDPVGPLNQTYTGGRYFSQMLLPDDYVKAIRDAQTAPTFEEKQKLAQQAMKLMIDKYCLQIILYNSFDSAVSQTTLRDHGFYVTPDTGWWTPEDAWLAK